MSVHINSKRMVSLKYHLSVISKTLNDVALTLI